jgi:hypothetical protein
MGSNRLGAPVPEEGNTAGFRNVEFVKKFRSLTKSKKLDTVSESYSDVKAL